MSGARKTLSDGVTMQSKPKGRLSLAYVLVAALVVLLVTAVVFSLHSGRTVSNSSTTTTQTAANTFPTQPLGVNNSNGLEFTMSLNTTTLRSGSNLTVSLSLYNILDSNNTVTGSTDWLVSNASEDGPGLSPACAQGDPFRTEVLQGYYDLSNVSLGKPLVFIVAHGSSGLNWCLVYIHGDFLSSGTYTFSPLSDKALWTESSANQPTPFVEVVDLDPSTFSTSTGTFTVVSGDMWGDVQVAHFLVEPTGP
jgi:uncharacterized protein (UPF0333 family)